MIGQRTIQEHSKRLLKEESEVIYESAYLLCMREKNAPAKCRAGILLTGMRTGKTACNRFRLPQLR